ncbi:hypothetical protein B0H63DRAFT_548881 [Podospora didyma]|uniref:Monooxygenase n=1 Tax=Podospora didyma TaxID=330526 RepID=A0AAE0N8F4_9PEZI|nr:hypothetical protein B0H63DRAFT_548881 [Podospora didyma]
MNPEFSKAPVRVAVIGGGPSGLVTLRYLVTAHSFLGTAPIEAKLFESESAVGGVFHARTYEDAELVSSRQLTSFSDFRAREDDPDFLSAKRYVEYLNEYCSHFNLWPHIFLSTTVQSITRDSWGKHTVRYLVQATGEQLTWECDAIAVCSGLHVTPNVPQIAGIENIPMRIHSSEFKARSQFGVGKTVMVLGSGETGADVSYLAVTAPTKRVILCHSSGFHFAPKRNLNPIYLPILGSKPSKLTTVPLDNARASLFDTAYVHPLLRNSTALWTFYDAYVKGILWLTTGTPGGLGQYVGQPSPEKNHVSRIFFNKASNAAPYVSEPYRKTARKSLIERIRRSLIQLPIPDTHGREIDLAPWPDHVSKSGIVTFRNSGRPEWERMKNEIIKPDMVVFCTGYRQEFPFFRDHNKAVTVHDTSINASAIKPYPVASDADVRGVWHHDDPSVAFIGFMRPSLGAIPPISEMQAQLWIVHLLAPHLLPLFPLDPTHEPHYRLHHPKGSRINYGVDHESYVYQLALDMGSAMGACEIVSRALERRKARGGSGGGPLSGQEGASNGWWRLPLVWALGANINTKFRMRGPWWWRGAEEVMENEVWGAIKRRRWVFDHFLLSTLPMSIFGPLSLMVWIYATLYRFVFGVELGQSPRPVCCSTTVAKNLRHA